MPEVKEIRKFAKLIKSKIVGKRILEIKILNGRYKTHGPFSGYENLKAKLPLKVNFVNTKGKLLYFSIGDAYICSTLGLVGGWCYLKKGGQKYEFSEDDYYKYLPRNALKHLNVEFKTAEGSLYYYDVLSFGSLSVVGQTELDKHLNRIGPDIMDPNTTYSIFKTRLLLKDGAVGTVLMDQKIISGIGNYLRSDILYISRIDPFRKISSLTERELKEIYKNSILLTWGDYDKNYAKRMGILTKSSKLPSDYNRMFYVYNQETDIHGYRVIKKQLAGGDQKRTIYYVPEIQK